LAFGRESEGGWLLFLAAGAMLLINPLLIVDVGFQLSVTAMLGMIYVRPVISSVMGNITPGIMNYELGIMGKKTRLRIIRIRKLKIGFGWQ